SIMQTIEVNPIYWLAILSGLLAAFSTATLLVCTKQWHGAFSMDQAKGIQKFHTMPTPRIGGVALLAGALATWLALPGYTQQGQETRELLGLVL
ncbi:glycosyl transferase 4 family protein, partial [Salmonella enterica subsp. enterica serovar Weltevreden]|uniref:hypothetical protein n=1 Tax=Salmonella enterica TaxID=28901 RepID=UPI0029C33D26